MKLYFPLRPKSGLKVEEALRYQQVRRFESALEATFREARGTVTEPYLGHAEVCFDRSLSRRGPEVEEAVASVGADIYLGGDE